MHSIYFYIILPIYLKYLTPPLYFVSSLNSPQDFLISIFIFSNNNMFTSSTTITSDHYSILECPQQQQQISNMPLVMDMSTTKWKCNNIEIAPNCPRCASTNTKFCYYNNYSLSQPRYFCKGCRRYWTKGGSLRNVPIGGGCRKSRRARASASAATTRQGGEAMGPTPSPGESGNNNNNNTCIDMAAVYAKYVNQNAGVEESFSPGASSGSSSIDSQIEDVTMFEHQKVPILQQQQQALPQFMDGQDYVYQDFNAFDQMQQGMIGDENVLWSEGTTLPSFGSQVQPTMQVQDFGLISPDDNWGSFDLSAIEF